MIELRERKCKGTGKAKGHGCGKMTKHRTYGLGKMCCYPKWLLETPQGRIKMEKSTIRAKKKVSKEKEKERRKSTREQKIDLMSADQYRAKYLQPVINKIARLIDFGTPCIATNNYDGKMSGGHFHSVGSNRTLALNLHNIHIQSFHSNGWNGGDDKRYREGLEQRYGKEYLDFVDGLKKHIPIKLTKAEMKLIRSKAMYYSKYLTNNVIKRTRFQRIDLRNHINEELGIYDKEHSIFKINEVKN